MIGQHASLKSVSGNCAYQHEPYHLMEDGSWGLSEKIIRGININIIISVYYLNKNYTNKYINIYECIYINKYIYVHITLHMKSSNDVVRTGCGLIE